MKPKPFLPCPSPPTPSCVGWLLFQGDAAASFPLPLLLFAAFFCSPCPVQAQPRLAQQTQLCPSARSAEGTAGHRWALQRPELCSFLSFSHCMKNYQRSQELSFAFQWVPFLFSPWQVVGRSGCTPRRWLGTCQRDWGSRGGAHGVDSLCTPSSAGAMWQCRAWAAPLCPCSWFRTWRVLVQAKPQGAGGVHLEPPKPGARGASVASPPPTNTP